MARFGEVSLQFGDEERPFCIAPIKCLRAIQDKCGVGLTVIAQRLAPLGIKRPDSIPFLQWVVQGGLGTATADDVREPIYQGLIGGGMSPTEAGFLVTHIVDERPYIENGPIALQIVLAYLLGHDDEAAEPVGEPKGEAAAEASSPPTARSASRKSTASAPRSAGVPATSTN